MEGLARLKKARTPLRGLLSRNINKVYDLLNEEEKDFVKLRAIGRILDDIVQNVRKLDSQILEEMLNSNCDEDALEEEHEDIQNYQSNWVEAMEMLEEAKGNRSSPAPSESNYSTASQMTTPTMKLPKIEFPKFGGETADWLGWWAQFQTIHDNVKIETVTKFQYLAQSMTAGSPASKAIKNFPVTAENYQKAIDTLKEQFGDSRVLWKFYMRELIKMVQDPKKKDPFTLYNLLQSQLRAVESLGEMTRDDFLCPLVESSMSEDLMVAWQRSPKYGVDGSKQVPPKTELDFLLEFLKEEGQREKVRNMGQSSGAGKKREGNFQQKVKQADDIPTAAGLFNGQGSGCIFCEKSHESELCRSAEKMSLEEKKGKVKKSRSCFLCLKKGHQASKCRAFVKCLGCQQKHVTILCPTLNLKKKDDQRRPQSPPNVATNVNCCNEVLLKTLIVKIEGEGGKCQIARVLVDDGSQRSYIKKSTADQLNLKPVGKVTQRKTLFGGATTEVQEHNKYQVVLRDMKNFKQLRQVTLLEEKVLTGDIPKVTGGQWMEELKKKKIWLSDFNSKSSEIEILIGSDDYPKIVTGRTLVLECGLLATETVFGWMVQGRTKETIAMTTICSHVQGTNLSDLWALEPLGIRDPIEVETEEEQNQKAKSLFQDKLGRGEDGRYSVGLPWNEGVQNIPNNKQVAEKRLMSATNKLEKEGRFQQYDDIFHSWLEEGIIEEVSDQDYLGGHYLPHRPVFKESATTPVRPVFDASCKVGRNPCLNDCLYKGPNLLELVPSVLLRFRENNLGVTADIRKAFQMIALNEDDRDFVRFLWWGDKEKKKLKILRHARVVFGLNSSPFMLAATIEHHLSQVPEEHKATAIKLLKSFYADNAVTSVKDYEEYEDFRLKSIELMAEAKMELRVWEVSENGTGSSDQGQSKVTQVLGLQWDKVEDTLSCTVPSPPLEVTKRSILSLISKIFDPIGFTGPALIKPKIILQQTWAQKFKRDEELPDEVKREFVDWCQDLSSLSEIKIPRQAIHSDYSASWRDEKCQDPNEDKSISKKVELHTFVDASQEAYAAVVFARTETSHGVKVELLQAKNRVTPIKMSDILKSPDNKKPTIPRLELMACLIGARLHKATKSAMEQEVVSSHFWTDSTTALAWINRNNNWGTFVGNRVKEILTLSEADQWSHVPGVRNPADLPSRGCSPGELLESKWWEGPEWLKQSKEEWPRAEVEFDEDAISIEMKKGTIINSLQIQEFEKPRFSTYTKNLRVFGWVNRFVQNLKKKKEKRNFSKFLKIEELREAEPWFICKIQKESFPEDVTEVGGVKIIEKDGVLRAVTKLTHGLDKEEFRCPVLLPKGHPLVKMLILEMHYNSSHGGVQFLMGKIREKYWIPSSRKTIKSVINKCLRCKRHESKPIEVEAAALPLKRITVGEAFQVTGVDLMGPLNLRDGTKVWVVLYTCATYRCVSLDIVTSISAEAFLLSLERFINLEGRPNDIFSDNGTNFVGANNLMKRLDWEELEGKLQVKRISWNFNPPTASWWGGFWERLVGSTKVLLRRVLGAAKINFDELRTCLAAVAQTINGRPLTTVSEDPEDLLPLTPAMFMRGLPMWGFLEGEVLTGKGLQRRYRRMQSIKSQLQTRFRKEYLAILVQKAQKKRPQQQMQRVKVGDVVLIGADNVKRVLWPLGRIVELIPGKDGNIRVAKLRTKCGMMLRPIQRIYPLEIEQGEEMPKVGAEVIIKVKKMESTKLQAEIEAATRKEEVEDVVTKRGRVVKMPRRYLN